MNVEVVEHKMILGNQEGSDFVFVSGYEAG